MVGVKTGAGGCVDGEPVDDVAYDRYPDEVGIVTSVDISGHA